MAAPAGVFRYTSLPAEIRNAIMEYALVPGEVYPCPNQPNQTPRNPSRKLLRAVFKRPPPPPPSTPKTKAGGGTDSRVVPTTAGGEKNKPAFHLLAACRQTYADGHDMFYTQNTFHLPPGSARDAEAWLARRLAPAQRRLVRSACVTLCLADLTPAVLAEMERRWLWDLRPPGCELRRLVAEVAHILCWRYWLDKMRVLKGWGGLERVLVRRADGELVAFEGEAFRRLGEGDEAGLLEGAREVVRGELEGLVGGLGWKGFRRWVMGGGGGGAS